MSRVPIHGPHFRSSAGIDWAQEHLKTEMSMAAYAGEIQRYCRVREFGYADPITLRLEIIGKMIATEFEMGQLDAAMLAPEAVPNVVPLPKRKAPNKAHDKGRLQGEVNCAS